MEEREEGEGRKGVIDYYALYLTVGCVGIGLIGWAVGIRVEWQEGPLNEGDDEWDEWNDEGEREE